MSSGSAPGGWESFDCMRIYGHTDGLARWQGKKKKMERDVNDIGRFVDFFPQLIEVEHKSIETWEKHLAIACENGLHITEVRAEFIEFKGPGHGIDEKIEANPKGGIILGFFDTVAAHIAGSGGEDFNDQKGRDGRKGVTCPEAQVGGIERDIRFSASAF